MSIGAIGANPLFFLNIGRETRERNAADFELGQTLPANNAGALQTLPSSHAPQLSFENVMQLQLLDDEPPPTLNEMSNEAKFLEEARKDPIERMREQIMEELGISEADLAQMSPEERRVAEDQIRQKIEERLRQSTGAQGARPDSNAGMIQEFA